MALFGSKKKTTKADAPKEVAVATVVKETGAHDLSSIIRRPRITEKLQ